MMAAVLCGVLLCAEIIVLSCMLVLWALQKRG